MQERANLHALRQSSCSKDPEGHAITFKLVLECFQIHDDYDEKHNAVHLYWITRYVGIKVDGLIVKPTTELEGL